MSEQDAVMRGFLWYKAIIARYGVEDAAELLKIAQALVDEGVAANRVAAVAIIEEELRQPKTTPVSREVAEFTTHKPIALGPGQ